MIEKCEFCQQCKFFNNPCEGVREEQDLVNCGSFNFEEGDDED